jgi:hypothetical protein
MVFISRLICSFAAIAGQFFNNFNVVPFVIILSTTTIIALIMAYFASDRFEFLIKGRLKRFFAAAILLLFNTQLAGMLYATVDLHWWCGLFIFFVSLELLNHKLPSKWAYPLIVLSILSSPSALTIAFSALYFVVYKFIKRDQKKLLDKKYLVFFGIVLSCLVIQSIYIIFLGKKASFYSSATSLNEPFSLKHVGNAMLTSFDFSQSTPLYILSKAFFRGVMSLSGMCFLGGLVWIMFFYFTYREKLLKYAVFAFITSLFIFFMTFYKVNQGAVFGVASHFLKYSDIFYFAIPISATLVVFLTLFFRIKKKDFVIFQFIILAFLSCAYIRNFFKPEVRDNYELNIANNYRDFNSKTFAIVKSMPTNEKSWIAYIHVPVRPEYCEKEKDVVCETIDK